MKSKKGFTLIELMVVVLIVGILAAVAIPILRGRIDAAKWSEGKAMMGTIATAIRAYHADKGPVIGLEPTDIVGTGDRQLGFLAEDLTGTYFSFGDFALTAVAMDPLTFTITGTVGGGGGSGQPPAHPGAYSLDNFGTFLVTIP